METEAVPWQNLLSIIRHWLLLYYPDSRRVAVETLVSTARVVVGESRAAYARFYPMAGRPDDGKDK